MGVYLNNLIITIDGPSGSGKEKIAKYISRKYKLYHLDSGILYRRLSAIILKKKIKFNDEKSIKKILKSIKILSHRRHLSLRREIIGKKTSKLAAKKIVRIFINKQQHSIVSKILKNSNGCVIDGRDIGSTVFKNAQIKLFIDTDVKIRAKRRHKQLIALGEKSIYSRILKDLKLRDELDINRKISPLKIPSDAILIDNSKLYKFTCSQINGALKQSGLL